MGLIAAEVIKNKRNRFPLTQEEIIWFISSFAKGQIPDYQMSALLMAIYFAGMTKEETFFLMKAMLHSGVVVDFSDLSASKVDKHSTGGVGDKTSLLIGPIVSACGLAVPMISGRGLGHTGGTLDKLESIPGFNTQLDLEKFKTGVKSLGLSFIGQTKEICPADKKIYALRDVTATVESLPLICASIMSKKLAEGIDGLVLDVKFGSGAFMKSREACEELARGLIAIAEKYNKKVSAFLTNMDQPLGRFAGNSLEVEECLRIFKNEPVANDTKELSLRLSARMLVLGGAAKDDEQAYALCEQALKDGRAFEKFKQVCHFHGGDLDRLPQAKHRFDIFSPQAGYVHSMNCEKIGVVGIKIRAGRMVTSDQIDPTAGIEFHKKVGDDLKKGDLLFTLYGSEKSLLESAQEELLNTVQFSDRSVSKLDLIWKVL